MKTDHQHPVKETIMDIMVDIARCGFEERRKARQFYGLPAMILPFFS